MHVKSVLTLSTAGRATLGGADLAITHVTEDNRAPQFRRHAFLLITYLVDLYQNLVPRPAIVQDLYSLSGALSDLAQEMESGYAAKAA
jgi:hypothetical protein